MATTEFNLRALADALDRVSDEVKQAVGEKAQTAAIVMQRRVMQAYPIGPVHTRKGRRVGGGTLRASVVRGQPGRFAVTSHGANIPAAVVRALAPHVHFYEEGTAERFDPTRQNARRGRSPKLGPIFIATAIDQRSQMFREVEALLQRTQEL